VRRAAARFAAFGIKCYSFSDADFLRALCGEDGDAATWNSDEPTPASIGSLSVAEASAQRRASKGARRLRAKKAKRKERDAASEAAHATPAVAEAADSQVTVCHGAPLLAERNGAHVARENSARGRRKGAKKRGILIRT